MSILGLLHLWFAYSVPWHHKIASSPLGFLRQYRPSFWPCERCFVSLELKAPESNSSDFQGCAEKCASFCRKLCPPALDNIQESLLYAKPDSEIATVGIKTVGLSGNCFQGRNEEGSL